jgi:hypothetical protein
MAKPRRTTEQEWFNVFMNWPLADQAAALVMLAELHRQARRGKLSTPEQAAMELKEGA